MPQHSLTARFENAVRNLRAVMPGMTKKELKKAGFDIKNVPKLETEYWNARRRDNNCYAFALDRPGRFRIPGELKGRDDRRPAGRQTRDIFSDEPNFFEFAAEMHDGVLRDGLIELGDKPELSERGTLVAMFMGDKSNLEEAGRPGDAPDVHFYALRRKDDRLVWAHKPGQKEVEVCEDGPEAPFGDAPKRGDVFFAGFWLVPNPR